MKNLFGLKQTYPQLANRALAPISAAKSISASFKTMKGSFPPFIINLYIIPNSNTIFFRLELAD